MDKNIKEVLRFCLTRDIVNLYKSCLDEFKTLNEEHIDNQEKLRSLIPYEYHRLIDSLNFLDGNRAAFIRKRILDKGNDTIRQMDELINKIDHISSLT